MYLESLTDNNSYEIVLQKPNINQYSIWLMLKILQLLITIKLILVTGSDYMNDYKFGNFLCMLREKNGMTQADLANKLGVTPAAVSKWENGSSKPRVEILFQVAHLLGVRVEELMSGQYIAEETLDPEVVKQIYERYTYLVQVDTYNMVSVKWRRFLAWVIDWNLIGFSVMILTAIVFVVLDSILHADSQTIAPILMLVILLYPVCFVLRDLIFGGRSLGKRIMGLVVLDRQTGMQANAGKCAFRNLFLFIVHIDAIVMLASGTTIGDRAAHTVVVRKSSLNNNDCAHQISEINLYSKPKKVTAKKTILTIAAIVAIVLVILFSTILLGLSSAKKTEEYKVAYNYLIESQTFEEACVDESKIWFNQYSLTTYSDPKNDNVTQTAEIGFVVKGKTFRVICHKQNNTWTVCDECTKFR